MVAVKKAVAKKATPRKSNKEGMDKRLAQALKLHQDGRKMQEILEITELNYSQAWLFITDAELPANQRIKAADKTPATVVRLRDKEQNSWGLIMVRFGYREFGEGKIRRMYEEATGDKSQGLRNGNGGRFWNNDPDLYAGDNKKPGIRVPKETKRSDLHEIAVKLRTGRGLPAGARRVSGAVKKAKASAPVTKKATAKKVAKKVVAKKAA